jgi:glycosyltransferase involved in cell wall biosynthesis
MALGKPVIATRGGGTNEVIINNQNGYLINPDDSDGLIKCIQILKNDKNLRNRLGLKSKEIAHRIFDLQIMTENYLKMYYDVLKLK